MNRRKKIIIVLIVSILMLTELIVTELNVISNRKESDKIIDTINREMEVMFNDALITSEVLKEMVIFSQNHSISLEVFNELSKTLLSTYSNVNALFLLPHGVVTLAYPYEEHKLIIGHNILLDQSRKRGANYSIIPTKTTIIGPIKLIQNNQQAFILRKGISTKDKFIGFSSSLIYLESVLIKLDKILKNSNITNYSVVGYDPDNTNYYDKIISSKGVVDYKAHKGIVRIFNTNWQITISPSDTSTLSRLLVLSILLSILFLIIVPIRYFKKYRLSERKRYDLQNEAHTDFLTELLNRRGLESRFETLKIDKTSGFIAIFDIDYFKSINDSHGHEVGDIVLVQFSKLCADNMNPDFSLSRTGGEEFMMLMPHLDQEQAKLYCDHLRETVERTQFLIKDLSINITVSIGITSFCGAADMKYALRNADDALYEAKNKGRNRVCLKS